ncbi:MAG: family transporter [Acidobacteria bacterium]|jgi:membrane fusion protein (multidrug efflux system)|nr:family transporter [Acidobacteriota bacterium]
MNETVKEKTETVEKPSSGNGSNGLYAGDSSNIKEESVQPDGLKVDSETPKRNKTPFYVVGAILLAATLIGSVYWVYARQYESTDDAFIDGDIVQISPKISAYVTKVLVKENQAVKKGDLLVELNTEELEARLEQAKAELRAAEAKRGQAEAQTLLTRRTASASRTQARSNVETAQTNVEQTRLAAGAKQSEIRQAQTAVKTARANLAQAQAQIPQMESNLQLAETEYNRRLGLFNRGDVSRQSLDIAANAVESARAQAAATRKQVEAAQARVEEAEAGVGTAQENYRQSLSQIELTRSQVNESTGRLEDADAAPERIAASESEIDTARAAVAQAETFVAKAELDLSYARIHAPEDGFVTRKNVHEGQLVQPGAILMALSQSKEIWVVANFKETQFERMRVGQPVEIKVDAYPNKVFRGKIESFQAGTGSRFSVLPSENASGNFVKVVQRIPVKIVFEEKPENIHLLVPGMSVQPRVKVR